MNQYDFNKINIMYINDPILKGKRKYKKSPYTMEKNKT